MGEQSWQLLSSTPARDMSPVEFTAGWEYYFREAFRECDAEYVSTSGDLPSQQQLPREKKNRCVPNVLVLGEVGGPLPRCGWK